jgi:hypothetical protein
MQPLPEKLCVTSSEMSGQKHRFSFCSVPSIVGTVRCSYFIVHRSGNEEEGCRGRGGMRSIFMKHTHKAANRHVEVNVYCSSENRPMLLIL